MTAAHATADRFRAAVDARDLTAPDAAGLRAF